MKRRMAKMQHKKELQMKSNFQYKVETFPLSIINLTGFENTLNAIAQEGWELKHTFTTTGLKLVTIWEK